MFPARSRRDFLKSATLATSALALAKARSWAATGLDPAQAPRKILILGAGMTGLVAAWELKRAGHQVIVLEATLRPGRRVRTLRQPFSDGLYAEAGAGRIPVTHNLTRDYIQRVGEAVTRTGAANLLC